MDHQIKKERNDFGCVYGGVDGQQGHSYKNGQHSYDNDIQRQHVAHRRPHKDNHLKIKDAQNRPSKKVRQAMKKERMSKESGDSGGAYHTSKHYHHHSKQRQEDGFSPFRSRFMWRRPLTNVDTLPYPAEGVEVVYTNDPADAESWLKNNVIDADADALGLDIEWRPQFVSKKNGGTENKTAVLQLAVEDSALVLHVFHMKSFPKSLSEVLANRNVLKVGSGIKGDVIKLIRDTGMLCDGRVDTQDYAKVLGIESGLGLKRLSKKILDIDLDKPKRISLSNWESFPLRKDQISYAALDAWIGLKLFIKLKDQLTKKNEGESKPQVIHIGVDEPEIFKKSHTCQGCNETLPTKGKLFRHKIRCIPFNVARNKDSSTGSNPNNQLPTEQQKSDISGSLLDSGTLRSGYSGISVLSEESSEVDVIVCPVSECRAKCQGQDDFKEHIQIARHACCKKCGKVFRSKVSRHHLKLHYSQEEVASKILN